MITDPSLHAEVTATLAELNRLMRQRDLSILDRFTEDVLLIGSEAGEIAQGRAALRALFEQIFALPVTIGWEWDDIRPARAGDVCWFFAEGVVAVTSADGTSRRPYRLSGVLRRVQDAWILQQFHGAEPVAH